MAFRYDTLLPPSVLLLELTGTIDHADLDEKAVVVPFMKDICSTAKQVFVWLGPENDDRDLAIDVLC